MVLAVTNIRLIDPDLGRETVCDANGGLAIKDGKIAEFGQNIFTEGLAENAQIIDGDGLCLAPGLVDMRVHLREPGADHKEDISGLLANAAASGITSLGVLPNTDPVIDDIAVLEFIQRRAAAAPGGHIYCFGAATKDAAGAAMSEIGLLAEGGALGFTDGTQPIEAARLMATLLRYGAMFDAVIANRPNEPSLSGDGVMNAGEMAARLGLAGMPVQAETIMLARDLMLVEMTGGRYHASLISTAGSVDLIRAAKAKGLDVSCDTAPPYFVLNEGAVGDYRTFAKLMPPLRDETDRLAVAAALADGTIDMIVSDHAAQDAESKRLPFSQAEIGGVGVETLLPLTLELTCDGSMNLAQALAKVSIAPADRFGLPGGRITEGAPADLVLFDADRSVSVSTENLRSKSKNTPFDGRTYSGEVTTTIIGGTVFEPVAGIRAA